MKATTMIFNIINDAHLLPFELSTHNAALLNPDVNSRWPGANSGILVDGLGEGGYDGIFTVYYNRFDLSSLHAAIKVYVNEETTLEEVKAVIVDALGAFYEELTFDVVELPPVSEGDGKVIKLVPVTNSVAYYGASEVAVLRSTGDLELRLMEDSDTRLMEDGTVRFMES